MMKTQYRFAKLYLGLLLICAGLVCVYGLGIATIGFGAAVGASGKLHKTEDQVVAIDTDTIVRQLEITYSLVAPIAKRNQQSSVPCLPEATAFPIARSAMLTPKELSAFMVYITNADTAVQSLKDNMLFEFSSSISTMITATGKALVTRSGSSLSKRTDWTEHVADQGLFTSGAITSKDLETLRSVGVFLRDKTASYSPSRRAQDLAQAADKGLQGVIEMIEGELQDGERERQRFRGRNQSQPSSAAGVGEKTQLIGEFMDLLFACRDTVTKITLADWRIDGVIATARTAVNAHYAESREEMALLRQLRSKSITDAVAKLLGSLIVAILLLVIRDFMAAVIDTATNTRGMLERLSGADVEIE
ncbi:MAG: hypothetical protein HN341_08460 [Verrucomicrobia bacterium]|jgi:hypothetical protein|nr:hypothetical protein [Verrucomicrobiota bacterium]